VIVELNGSGSRYGFDDSKIIELMLSYGFNTYSYDPFDRTLMSIQGKNLNSGNTLFIRNKSVVDDRLRSAPTVTINGQEF
jgi:hypothetical protein